ncbi:MAG: 50S ribosomal protein L18 [Thermoplasmata archaeon]|nr:50S ribosomal protein L18 [Thermoplasmata archaeon]MCI4359085.1 50S ribosomal protein L18 [Thermoplasmata archaeon]
MSKGPRHKVAFRRRREGRTDYRSRLKLLKSGQPRAVVRFSERRVIVALTAYDPTGDRVIASAESGELTAVGFPASSLSSTPASYLTGYLAGLRARSAGASEAVLDSGIRRPSQGGRLLGALRGLLDAGLSIPHGEGSFPGADRLNGAHLKTPLAQPLETFKQALPARVVRATEPT